MVLSGNARNISALLQISYCLFYLKEYSKALDYLSYGLSASPDNIEMKVWRFVIDKYRHFIYKKKRIFFFERV